MCAYIYTRIVACMHFPILHKMELKIGGSLFFRGEQMCNCACSERDREEEKMLAICKWYML